MYRKWSDWEKHLDWMAIQGINMPLAFNGQEYVFAKTFNEFGFNTTDLQTFFSGPAFYAWYIACIVTLRMRCSILI